MKQKASRVTRKERDFAHKFRLILPETKPVRGFMTFSLFFRALALHQGQNPTLQQKR
jgi:hypothetical protein